MNQLLETLRHLNISFGIDSEGKLDIEAPKGVLTPEIIETIRDKKEELIRYLLDVKARAHEGRDIPNAEEGIAYPLSSSQMRLWIMHALNKGSIAYNMHGVLPLSGTLDLAKYEMAIRATVGRHEIMRTVFREHEGTVRQWILPADSFEIAMMYEDLSGCKDGRSKAKEIIHEDVQIPFDLEKAPLFRIKLLQVDENAWLFYFNMHHIISDGWSMKVLSKDIHHFYEAFTKGVAPSMKPLRIQYKDYACWQQQEMSGENFVAHRTYWLHQLSGDLPVLTLPFSHPRPPVMTSNGNALSLMINKEMTEALQTVCQLHQGTLFMGLLSVMNALLYRYSGQEDIIIGSPVAGREHADLEDQIGFYINTLALRTRFSGNDSFAGLLVKVREVTLSAYNHQLYPFDSLVEDLDIKRDMSRSPVTDIILVLQNQFEKDSRADVEPVPGEDIYDEGGRQVKLDLHISFSEKSGGLQMTVQYNSDVYDRLWIARMMEHYRRLLVVMVSSPEKAISDHEYIQAAERHQLLVEFNDTAVAYPPGKTILDLFRGQVKEKGAEPAVVYATETISYRELEERSNQLAHYLLKKGIKREMAVPVCLDRSVEMIVSILGIMKAGGAYVPVDPGYPQERISYMLGDIDSPLVITQSCYRELFEEAGNVFKIMMDRDWIAIEMEPVEVPITVIDDHQLAYVIYTSGSTGKPKGVMIEHGSLYHYLGYCRRKYLYDSGKTWKVPLFTSLSFDLTVTSILGAVCSGGILQVYPQDQAIQDILEDIFFGPGNINFMKCTPSHIEILREFEKRMTTVEGVIAGGEELKQRHVSLLQSFNQHIKIYNEYGPTEATVGCVVETIEGVDERSPGATILIGKPIDNTRIYILDPNLHLVPAGITGELYIGGPQLARGYRDSAGAASERFIADPFNTGERLYRSGDLARWLEDGRIEFKGRIDDQVKISGYRIEPAEIEDALTAIASVTAACVIAQQEESGQAYLVAYVVSEAEQNGETLRSQLAEYLPAYMVPTYFIQLPRLPLTANGKIDKQQLPDPGKDSNRYQSPYAEPNNDMEQLLVQIWLDLFKTNRQIGIKDNFFELGGNSLRAISLINILKRKGYAVKIDDVLKYPVIETLAEKVTPLAGTRIIDVQAIEPVPVQPQLYDLSWNQRLYFNNKVLAHSYGTISFRLENFDQARFTAAYHKLVAETDVLRLKFTLVNDQLQQETVLFSPINYPIRFINRRKIDLDDDAIDQQTRSFLKEPFDIFNGEVTRCGVLHDNNEAYVIVAIHHIATDNDSNGLLRNKLLNGYHGKEHQLPASPFSYRDFIYMQKQFPGSEQGKIKMAWWEQHLVSLAKQPMPVWDGYLDIVHNRQAITGERFKTMHNFCISESVFPGTFLLGVFYIFVTNEYPGMDEFIMETVINGQDMNLPDFCIDNVVGLFSDSMLLKCSTEDRLSFKESVKYIQGIYLQGRMNQEIHSMYLRHYMKEKYALQLSERTVYYMNYISDANQQPMPPGHSASGKITELPTAPSVTGRNGLPVKCYEYADGIVLDWEARSKPGDTLNHTETKYFLKRINSIIDKIIGHRENGAEMLSSFEFFNTDK